MRQQFSTARTLLAALAAGVMLLAAAPAAAQPAPAATPPLALAEGAPQSYTVVKGDTLWAISGKFLKDPWRWPEIWRINREQIKNPHRIYPGDVIVLDITSEGTPRLTLTRDGVRIFPATRVSPLNAAQIPSIPPGDLEPYLTKPLITGPDGLNGTAEIVAGRDRDRVIRGQNDRIYVVGIDPKAGDAWYIYRPGKALLSLDTGEVLGFENRYIGSAKVERFAEVSTVNITDSVEEVFIGDRLVPVPREVLVNYVPHAPDKVINGRIIASYRNASEMGRGAIVTIDRGVADGIDVGAVLAIYRGVAPIADPRANTGLPRILRFLDQTTVFVPDSYLNVPQERTGLLFVFRTFDRLSYAILLNTTDPVTVGDLVRTP